MERKRKKKGYEIFTKIAAGIVCCCMMICAMPFASAGKDSVRDSIPGLSDVCLYDSAGKSIRAFGGQVQKFTENGETKWYWIGEDAETKETEENGEFAPTYHNGIHLYSSKDLYNWEDEGIILKTMNAETDFEEAYFQNLYGDLSDEKKQEVFQCLDGNTSALTRPKVLYDGEKYVIWFTMIGGNGKAGIAVSDSIKGPFRFLKTIGEESGGIIGNLNLFRDTDGKAYVIYNAEYMNPASGIYGSRIYCSQLKENDYTELADEPRKIFFSRDYNADTLPDDYGTDFSRSDVGTMFRHGNRYYMMNAGENKYAVTDSLDKPWEVKQLLFWDGTSASEIDCKIQSSSMISTGEGKDLEYIHIGDNGEWTSPEMGRHIWLPVVFMEDKENPIALKKCSNWKLKETSSGSESEGEDFVRDSIPGLSDVCLYDSKGKSIRAFGGQVQKFTENGETKWYWIGEDAEIRETEENEGFVPTYHNGIHLYSSKDLYNWEDEGIILKTMNAETDFEETYFQNLYGDLSDEKKDEVFQNLDRKSCFLTRPKVLYDGEKYVNWFSTSQGKAGIATSDSIKGPFRFLKTIGLEASGIIGNLNLFRDTDGMAYVIYNAEYMNPASGVYGARIYCSRLKENDYTEFADEPRKTFFSRDYNADTLPGNYGTDFSRYDVGTMFQYENQYFMMHAGENKYAVTSSLDEPWEIKTLQFWDGTSVSEIDCKIQSSSVILAGEGEEAEYIHIGDNGEWSSPDDGRHIWLPIVFMEDEDNPIALKKCSDWKLNGAPSGSEGEGADGSKLSEKIREYESLRESDHTAASWAGYASVLNDAKKLIEQLATAKQKDVDDALEALQAARENLVTLESVLDSALQLYQDVRESDEYPQGAWAVFLGNLRAAQVMKERGGYTESQMEKIIADLKISFENLRPMEKPDPDEEEKPEETDPKPIKVTEITVTGTVKKLAKGKKMNLGASVLPFNATDKRVFWTSSNPAAAEVDMNGVVTGKAAGTAVITAFAEDGSGVSGSYTVKVVKHKIKKIIITANKKKVAAGKKVKVKAVIKTSGKTANKTLEWSTSNEKYAVVNAKGVVTTKKAGKGKTVTVTARAMDGSGKKDSVKIKIK